MASLHHNQRHLCKKFHLRRAHSKPIKLRNSTRKSISLASHTNRISSYKKKQMPTLIPSLTNSKFRGHNHTSAKGPQVGNATTDVGPTTNAMTTRGTTTKDPTIRDPITRGKITKGKITKDQITKGKITRGKITNKQTTKGSQIMTRVDLTKEADPSRDTKAPMAIRAPKVNKAPKGPSAHMHA